MKVSGFTIIRNAIKYGYPFIESIKSILPVCDEFIVNVGESDDGTLAQVKAINSPKITILETKWNMEEGKTVLSRQTNLALKHCRGDWAFYLQSDEVIHEQDLPRLKRIMTQELRDENSEALRFSWLHFYGSYYRYRIDSGWFQKQDRIILNNGAIESFDDAYGFRRKDGKPLKRKNTGCLLYHYGWVQPPEVMTQRRVNAEQIGFATLQPQERREEYNYGDLNRFPVYWGTHPAVMKDRVSVHELSLKDQQGIQRKYWWHPFRIFKTRKKTWKRIKNKVE